MARSKARQRSSKRRSSRWLLYLVASAALVGLLFTAWLWLDMREWRPSTSLYPEQGALIASGQQDVKFLTIKAIGGEFAYLELREASLEPDRSFAARLEAARQADLQVGIVLRFDPCLRADAQSARYTRMVPRSEELLPPAIALGTTARDCPDTVSDAAVQSELVTLVNQIEMHTGKSVILKLGERFEQTHRIANMIERDLWLERDRARPSYAGRPWLLWSANRQLMTEAAEDAIEWVVVQK